MPRGDHRGPDGEGPRTGRGMGFCRGAGRPGFVTASQEEEPTQSGQGRQGGGRGCGGGRHGRRRRHLFHTTGLTGWQQEAPAAETTDAHEAEPSNPGTSTPAGFDR